MDQISPPFRIALVVLLVFVGAWLTVLRPHPADGGGDEAPLPAPPAAASAPATSSAPGVAGLERSVRKAKGAASASEASTAAVQAADPEKSSPAGPAPAARAAAAPKPATAKPVTARKPATPAAAPPRKTVLLFAGAGADDAVARQVVSSVRRHGVRTIIASLSQLGRYRDLVGTMQIASAPTILVIGRDRKAQLIEGLPDAAQVRAALAAAR